jgi:Flp pilus assembly protein TadB
MSWDRMFWFLFAISESILIMLIWLEFSTEYIIAAALVFVLAVPKLAEDSQKLKNMKRGVSVRKDILNKLKRYK